MQLPESFVKTMQELLGPEAVQCMNSIDEPAVTSIRVNKHKPTGQFNDLPPVPWNDRGKYLAERPMFIADPLFHAGTYYVQESSSMFLTQVLKHIKARLGSPVKVLDLCAAPGGKSTLILDELTDDDLLVSNEIIKTRVNILEENIIRWGRSNVVVTNDDPSRIALCGSYFDIMIIDAPCSGEGMFRKDKNAINEWSAEHTLFCAQRQKRIFSDALKALKPGGYLVYSTCTFNQSENEANVKWLMEEFGYRPERIPVDHGWGIDEVSAYDNQELYAYRFYPHKVKGEGFFLSCLQKPGDAAETLPNIKEVKTPRLKENEAALVASWIDDINKFYFTFDHSFAQAVPVQFVNDVAWLRSKLTVKLAGLRLGEVMKQNLVPDHQLAFSIHLNKEVPVIEVDKLHALKFLKKDTFHIPGKSQGIYLITYKNYGLGWAKVLPNRINNYLPVNWRILKDLNQLIKTEAAQ